MSAIDNLNKAVSDLQAAINAVSLPVQTNNDAAIQAAADSINAAIVTLNTKLTPAV